MRSKPPTRPDQARPDQARPDQARPGQARPGQQRPDQPNPSHDRTGQQRLGQPRPTTQAPTAASEGPRRAPPRDRNTGPRPSRPPEPGQTPRLSARPTPTPRPEPASPTPQREPTSATLRAPPQQPAPQQRQSGPAAPRGTVWLHGIHPVAAALANPARRPKRLLLTEDAETNLAQHLSQPWPIQTERIERARLDHLLGRDTVHQGIALLADLLPPPALATILARPGPILVLDQVTDPRNIGATLRSAAAFGAAAVILQDRNAPDETGVMAKAASGALELVPLLRAVNLARTLVALKAAGLWVIGLEANAPPLRGTALSERRVVLVLGAEGDGMRRLVRETCDELCGLAMPGVMESLNVSAAATLALYELTRPK